MAYAFVFPGQGSQQVGMMRDHYRDYRSEVAPVFEEASDTLGYDVWDLIQNGPGDRLDSTEFTQPAILAASIAVWRVWSERGPAPSQLAGHSLGEYSALVAADALSLADAVQLVATRGQLMQSAVAEGEGAMAAVLGLDLPTLTAACEQAAQGDVVVPANLNAPGQIVISGEREAVARAAEAASHAGAKRVITLPVSVPSHCALMQPAAAQLAEHMDMIVWQQPSIPVWHNHLAAPATDVDDLKQALSAQLYQPVRWIETVEAMRETGVGSYYECGPGKVLCGMIKRIDRKLSALPLETPTTMQTALEKLS